VNPNQSISVRGAKPLGNSFFSNYCGFGSSLMNKSRRAPLNVMSAVSKRAENSEYTVSGVQNMDDSEIANYQD
jgi:hypothetical protein